MLLLSILGVLVACVLMAFAWEQRERERHERRMSLIRWYTDRERDGE